MSRIVRMMTTVEVFADAEHEKPRSTIFCENCGETLVETLICAHKIMGDLMVEHAKECDAPKPGAAR
jgi:hypothetical protein